MRYLLFAICSLYISSCSTNKVSVPASDSITVKVDSSFYHDYWSGDLRYQVYHLPLGFNITKRKITFDNPVQGGNNVAVDSFHFKDTSLEVFLSQLKFTLIPESKNLILASLEESDEIREFELHRGRKLVKPDRPQHPGPTTSYTSSPVSFANVEEQIKLSGTLTSPLTQATAGVILLSGSGPQDRDETILEHRPFAVIADELTKRGVMVLRYDDRGMGESEGSYTSATTFDFAKDAKFAYEYLHGLNPNVPIGFIGHSEGAMLAQVADSLVGGASFHIYLAGPGIDILDLMTEQNEMVYKSIFSEDALKSYISGIRPLFELITSTENREEVQKEINEKAKALYNSLPPEDAKKIAPSDILYAMSISQLRYLKWWPYFLSYKPRQYLKQIKCPILALNGEKDIQVTTQNLSAIKKYATQSEVAVFTLEDTNHLFQRCISCKLSEYGMLTETFSPYALDAIITWLAANEFIVDQ